jgi:hypothetical protein
VDSKGVFSIMLDVTRVLVFCFDMLLGGRKADDLGLTAVEA